MSQKGNVHTLTIDEVYPDDEGTFACEVFNKRTEDETKCKVKVLEKGQYP